MTIEEAFGVVIRRLRKEFDISQDKLSETSGLDRTYISQIERGKQNPSLVSLFALASAMNVSPSSIISEAELVLKISHPDQFRSEQNKWNFDWVNEIDKISNDVNCTLSGSETILIVDDERPIRNMMSSLLRNYGYHVLLAENGQDALDIYKNDMYKVDLVIMDVVMPVKDGLTAFKEMKAINPGSRIYLTSGYHNLEVAQADNFRIIQKPYSPMEIIKVIRKSLDGAEPAGSENQVSY